MFLGRQRSERPAPLGFRPPELRLDAELEWLLQRAFAPPGAPTKPLVSAERAVEVALRLDVASRIASRQPRALLESELGAEAALRLRAQYVATVGQQALLERALDQVLEHAARARLPCIPLKYAALSRSGLLRSGARTATDIDVLVPEDAARAFQADLLQRHYENAGMPGSAHQLPALRDPNGVLIEVHLHLPGIRLAAGQPFARARDLLSAGLTSERDGIPLPVPALLTAHALVHGLVQHARAPQMYSPLKVFADLADLQAAGHGDFEQAGPFVSGSLASEDFASALSLARALTRGDLHAAMRDASGRLLCHCLATQLDPDYARRLRLRALTGPRVTPLKFSARRVAVALRDALSSTRAGLRRGRRS